MPKAKRPTARPTAAKKARGTSQAPVRELEKLRAELVRAQRESRALREIGLAMGSVAELDRILEIILAKIAEALDADRATLFLVDEGSGDLVSRVMSANDVETLRVPAGRGIAGHVAAQGTSIRVKEAYADPRFLRTFDDLTGYRTKSILAAPMRNHLGRIIGVVQALNKRKGAFTAADEALMTAIATQAAVAVDNSRMYLSAIQRNSLLLSTKEALEQKVRELDLLFSLESAMAHASTLDDLVRAALKQAIKTSGARGGAVLLSDEFMGQSTLRFLSRGDKARLRRLVVSPSEGFIGRVRQAGKAVLSTTPEQDGSSKKLDEAFGFETVSAIGAPLEGAESESIGAIALYNKDGPRGFVEGDLSLLRLIAANVSTAVQLWLSRRDQERQERLSTIGRLLSSVIHDLKTPITVVSGYVQLMVGADDPKVRHEYAELVRKQFDLVTAMQREILEFARGEKSLLVRRVYLASFLSGLVESMKRDAEAHGIELTADVADRGIARFDEGRITRALHNLVRNSIDALSDRGGHVVVRVARDGRDVVFSVKDDGPGIPKDVEKRLFESFATSGKKGGTGLGLATVRKIVEEHGGSVWAETSSSGTTMTFRLPQDPAESPR